MQQQQIVSLTPVMQCHAVNTDIM